jgi:hypothetical protein
MYNALHDNQVLKFCSDDDKHSIDYVRSYRGRDGMVVGFINIYAIKRQLSNFQLYHDENKLICNETRSALY